MRRGRGFALALERPPPDPGRRPEKRGTNGVAALDDDADIAWPAELEGIADTVGDDTSPKLHGQSRSETSSFGREESALSDVSQADARAQKGGKVVLIG
jgi:hypothetical protein